MKPEYLFPIVFFFVFGIIAIVQISAVVWSIYANYTSRTMDDIGRRNTFKIKKKGKERIKKFMEAN